MSTWQERFKLFYDNNELGGSSRWLVSPNTVRLFVENELARVERKYAIDSSETS